jgi:CheY-like chemotaxis protein
MTQNAGKSGLILLAEDNPDDVFLMRRAFDKAKIGNPLHVVSDGSQVLNYVFGEGEFSDRTRYPFPTLLLLDVKMPRMNGFDVLRRIRESPSTRRLLVVILTSSSQHRDVNLAYDLGVNSYLVKPPNAESLQEMMAGLRSYWLSTNTLAEIPSPGDTGEPSAQGS